MEWNEELQLGVPTIDAQHRELFDLCRQFLEAARAGECVSLHAILDRLVERTRAHFQAEEQMLDRCHYPGLAAHRAEHDRLLSDARNLQARWPVLPDDEARRAFSVEVANYLRNWLIGHIDLNDKPYKPFLRNLA